MNDVGSWGNVWASSVDGSHSHNVNFNSDNADWNSNNRANGLSVRCLRDYTIFCRGRLLSHQLGYEILYGCDGNHPLQEL